MNNLVVLSELRSTAIRENSKYPQFCGHFDNHVLAQIVSQRGLRSSSHRKMFPIGLRLIASPTEHTSTDVNGKVGTFRTVYAQGYGNVSLPAAVVKVL